MINELPNDVPKQTNLNWLLLFIAGNHAPLSVVDSPYFAT